MSTAPTANVRVLELFVELLGARPGRTKAQLRSLPGYRGLADDAFETQFQRDKDALREAGAHLSIGRGERYSIARDSFAPDIEVTSVDRVLLSLAARAWDREDIVADSIDAKAAAASDEDVSAPAIRLGLRGLEAATSFARAIRERRVVTFEYPGSGDLTERAVEPWALSVQGRALYLWGWDLDRSARSACLACAPRLSSWGRRVTPPRPPRASRRGSPRWCRRLFASDGAVPRGACSRGTRPWMSAQQTCARVRAGSL